MAPVVAVDQPQHMRALQRANEVRAAIKTLKRDIAAGRLTVSQAIYRPEAGRLKVIDLLMAQSQWGRHRAVRLLAHERIFESKRVDTLTDRQRRALADACDQVAAQRRQRPRRAA